MTALQSIARKKMLSEPGQLYAAYSRYCDWVKIGFTSKTGRERLEAVEHQYPLFAPFTLIGETRSDWCAEQQLHGLMEPFRQRKTASTKELYPAVYAVMDLVKYVIRHREWLSLEWPQRRQIREWIRERADNPLNRALALESFAIFEDERKAVTPDIGGPIPERLRRTA